MTSSGRPTLILGSNIAISTTEGCAHDISSFVLTMARHSTPSVVHESAGLHAD
jgi:hypothetical protein